ncbi:DUF971 domain-containing protein [Sinorhizobium meliloti]|nr:DUF971 domain-containing protein [Sinorhizobium meliloti]
MQREVAAIGDRDAEIGDARPNGIDHRAVWCRAVWRPVWSIAAVFKSFSLRFQCRGQKGSRQGASCRKLFQISGKPSAGDFRPFNSALLERGRTRSNDDERILADRTADIQGPPPPVRHLRRRRGLRPIAELLRVLSPSAEVQGHGPSQRVTVPASATSRSSRSSRREITRCRIGFDDSHDTGIYTWTICGSSARKAKSCSRPMRRSSPTRV